MEWIAYLAAGVFSLVSLVCVLAVPVGLPGTWAMLAIAVGLELIDARLLGTPAHVTFGWPTLGIAAAIAVAAELLEAMAGAAGTRLGGGTRRGMVGAIVGGLLGAIALTPVLPIPLLGTLLGAFLGTFVGAFYAEYTAPGAQAGALPARAALGAVLGRLAGTLGKLMLAIVIWLVLAVAAFTP